MKKKKPVQAAPPIIFWVISSGASGEAHYCTNCGADLDSQKGFDPSGATWVCAECKQFLYGDIYDGERFPGVMWYCDECGDLLNTQKDFRDIFSSWKCLKCGHEETFDTVLQFQTHEEMQ